MKNRLLLTFGILLVCFITLAQDKNKFEGEIQKFEAQDKTNPPPEGAVLFTGSSSIRFWDDLNEDFAGIEVFNRGFGGATFSDVIYFMDRIVTPYKPKTIVIYAGSHDLRKEGGGPEEVLKMFKAFRAEVKKKLPGTKICYISMKPSLAKWETIDLDRKSNELLMAYCEATADAAFIDIWTPMMDGKELPSETYFKPDRNHPNEKCYKLWASIIRPYIE